MNNVTASKATTTCSAIEPEPELFPSSASPVEALLLVDEAELEIKEAAEEVDVVEELLDAAEELLDAAEVLLDIVELAAKEEEEPVPDEDVATTVTDVVTPGYEPGVAHSVTFVAKKHSICASSYCLYSYCRQMSPACTIHIHVRCYMCSVTEVHLAGGMTVIRHIIAPS